MWKWVNEPILLYGLLIYLAAINIIAFFLYGIDKWKARLIGIAVAGGSIGALLGMRLWHHKTQHAKFKYGLPTILILQLVAVVAAVYYYHMG